MRLFLSYGHDEHLTLALRLKDDLKNHNHEVWFDTDRLKGGADWERYIEDGLDRAEKVLLLLTPHSVRRPGGFCLNEVARAITRGLPIIPVMAATVEPPLSIARLQWLDFRDLALYDNRFAQLLEAIDHGRLDFDGAQARLHKILQPIDYDEPPRHLARFTGRRWVLREIKRWLASSGRRVLWITGEAGIGKSALSAWLCWQHPEIAGAHYCRYNNAGRSERRALLSLAWQLSTQLPDYADRLNASPLEEIAGETSLLAVFDRLFVAPFTHGLPAPDGSVVLLIDALDEARGLAPLIGTEWTRTPEWLRLIVTSRPREAEINSALQALDPWMLEAGRPENQTDIWIYLRRELGADDATIESIRVKSEGLFLYVSLVREEIESGRLSLENVDAFPRGLGGIYHAFFQRYFPDIEVYRERWRPVIEAVCAARQPLPVEEAARLVPNLYDPSEITSGLGSLFPDSGGGFRPFHQSVRDWVTDAGRAGLYVVRTIAGHERLATEGWRQYESGEQVQSYYVAHLAAHLAACSRDRDLGRLLLDPAWMERKLKTVGLDALIRDYEYRKVSGEAELVQGALRLSAHVLARDVSQFASQLVGRLLPHDELRAFRERVAALAHRPWLRPLQPALNPPGTALIRTLEGHSSFVNGVVVSPDGRCAVSASDDYTLKVWDLEIGRELSTLVGQWQVNGVAVSPDGRRAVTASSDKTLKVLDLETGLELRRLEGHSREVNGVAVSPDGRRAVSASRDKTLKVWDLENGRELRTLKGHSDWVNGVAVSLDGRCAVSASSDKTLKVWDLETGRRLRTLKRHSAWVRGVELSPDGRRAVSASDDNTLKVWDLETGRELHTLKGHSSGVNGVAVTPDGRRAVSASHDRTVKVWDLETGRELRTLEGHSGWGPWRGGEPGRAACSFRFS
jgi:DNA-binding beta-propeller fold protein YncE